MQPSLSDSCSPNLARRNTLQAGLTWVLAVFSGMFRMPGFIAAASTCLTSASPSRPGPKPGDWSPQLQGEEAPPWHEVFVHREGEIFQVRMAELLPGELFCLRKRETGEWVGGCWYAANSPPRWLPEVRSWMINATATESKVA